MGRSTPSIAVVGAGIAGLVAARTLQDAGVACTVYEAGERVGGRMHSDSRWGDGLVSEWCGEFIDPAHTTMLHLVERFGLTLRDLEQEAAAQGGPVIYFGGGYVTGDALGQAFAGVAPLVQRQWQAAGYPTTYDRFTAEGYRLDQMSVFEWIARYAPGGHDALVGRFMNAVCAGLYGLETREQSALNLVYQFGARGVADESDDRLDLFQAQQEHHAIVGGNARLPEAIARSLAPGSVALGHRLLSIARAGAEMTRLAFATTAGVEEVVCDQVILALPFSALRQVAYQDAGFDERKRQAIEELGYGTISKLFLSFDAPYWRSVGPWPHPNAGFIVTDLEMQTAWDTTPERPDGRHILVVYNSGARGAAYAPVGAYTTSAEDPSIERYAQARLRQLEQVFPGISAHYQGRAALSYPTGDTYLLGSYSCWRVGQYTRFGGYEGARQGAIHFAGEHCSVEFQGYMEGAAREGLRAAREALQQIL